jgi:hypothetical protein
MEKIPALTEYSALVVPLDTEPLPQMNLANTCLQLLLQAFIGNEGSHRPLSDAPVDFSIHGIQTGLLSP